MQDVVSRPRSRTQISFGLMLIIGLIAAFAAAKPIIVDSMDPDFFWHVRVAEQLRHDGIGPITDHLAYASAPEPWTPYSWLAELGMEWLWRAGWRSTIVALSLMEAAFVVLLATTCRLGSRRESLEDDRPGDMAVAAATAAAAGMSLPYLSFRPVMMALVLIAIVCWLLVRDRQMQERSRAIWLIIPITALTANLHLYCVFVPIWVGALWAGAAIEYWQATSRSRVARRRATDFVGSAIADRFSDWSTNGPQDADPTKNAHDDFDRNETWRRLKRYSALLAASALACLATPMLPGMIAVAMHYHAADPMVASGKIAEMRPFYSRPFGKISAAIFLTMVFFIFRARRRHRIGEMIWFIGATVLLFRWGRFAAPFAIVAGPIFARSLPHMSDALLARKPIRIMLGAALALIVFRTTTSFPDESTTFEAWLNRLGPDTPGYPTDAAGYIAAHVPPKTGRLVNEFGWGGYIEWRLGDRFQALLDGRTQVFTADFWKTTYLGDEQQRAAYLSTTHADAALLPLEKSVFTDTLLKLGWQPAYKDARAQVLLPPAGAASNSSNNVATTDDGLTNE